MTNYTSIEKQLEALKAENLEAKSFLTLYKNRVESLFEMTESVNKNFNSPATISLLEKNLLNLTNLNRYVLILKSKHWQTMLNNTEEINLDSIDFSSDLFKITKTQSAKKIKNDSLNNFDYVIPVLHKNEHLAFLFIEKSKLLFGNECLNYIETLLNLTVIALENKKLFKKAKGEVVNEDLILAAEVQAELIPNVFPVTSDFEFYGKYIPFDIIGGDYYDFIELDEENIAFCICDVAGKGISAGMLMSNFQASLRTLLSRDYELKDLVIAINEKFINVTKQNRYISMFIAKYNIKTRKLEYVNAGHNPPILLNNNELRLLETGCTVLGMISDLPSLESEEIYLNENSFLLMYTDGLSEIQNEKDEEFDIHHLAQVVKNNHKLSLKQFTKKLINDAEYFKGENEIFDDVSILCAKFH